MQCKLSGQKHKPAADNAEEVPQGTDCECELTEACSTVPYVSQTGMPAKTGPKPNKPSRS